MNRFDGGRTYPLEGAAMVFPQHAPYTDPLEILICGGSTPFAGTAIDNCVTIKPEAPEPKWTIERMVKITKALSHSQVTNNCLIAIETSNALYG